MGGGIGDLFNVYAASHSKFYDIWGFELLFFFIINVIFLNIIFGIIIDTFAALRDEAKEREDDQLNICYVCGYSRVDMSKESIDFDDHIAEDHTPWKYIYF